MRSQQDCVQYDCFSCAQGYFEGTCYYDTNKKLCYDSGSVRKSSMRDPKITPWYKYFQPCSDYHKLCASNIEGLEKVTGSIT